MTSPSQGHVELTQTELNTLDPSLSWVFPGSGEGRRVDMVQGANIPGELRTSFLTIGLDNRRSRQSSLLLRLGPAREPGIAFLDSAGGIDTLCWGSRPLSWRVLLAGSAFCSWPKTWTLIDQDCKPISPQAPWLQFPSIYNLIRGAW